VDWGIHSYLGVPLLNLEKQPFGVLSVMDEKPIEDFDHYHSILNIFAARCSSEIERMDAEAQLGGEAQRAHHAYRVFPEADIGVADTADDAFFQVGQSVDMVNQVKRAGIIEETVDGQQSR